MSVGGWPSRDYTGCPSKTLWHIVAFMTPWPVKLLAPTAFFSHVNTVVMPCLWENRSTIVVEALKALFTTNLSYPLLGIFF
jgi:hypothetical protein